MKKVLILLTITFLISVCGPSVYATMVQGEENNDLLPELLKEQYAEQISSIMDTLEFHENMTEIDLDQPMIICYCVEYHAYAHKNTFEKNMEHIRETYYGGFILLGEEPRWLNIYANQTKIGAHDPYDPVPVYVQDILSGSVQQTFLGKRSVIQNVYLFREFDWDILAVYETDTGRYVRFYVHGREPAVEYTWEEYEEYAVAYMNYIQELYDDGNLVGGCSLSFVDFVEEYQAQKEAEHQAELEAARQKTIIYISIGVGATVLCAATATILLFHRRKKRQPIEE